MICCRDDAPANLPPAMLVLRLRSDRGNVGEGLLGRVDEASVRLIATTNMYTYSATRTNYRKELGFDKVSEKFRRKVFRRPSRYSFWSHFLNYWIKAQIKYPLRWKNWTFLYRNQGYPIYVGMIFFRSLGMDCGSRIQRVIFRRNDKDTKAVWKWF